MNDSFRQAELATSLSREAGVWVGDFRLFFVSLLRGMSTAVDRGSILGDVDRSRQGENPHIQ